MKVFADYHHGDLYYSLHALFEKRLGFELYRPIGLDWFENGFWKIAEPYGNPADTINQFLSTEKGNWNQYSLLNGDHTFYDGVYYVYDKTHDYRHKAITFEQFKSMKFDIIISSITAHDGAYEKLCKEFQPQAKLISQMGNVGQKTHIKNVMHSIPYAVPADQNTVYYHQEIDHRFWNYFPPNPKTKNIFSVVNCFPYPEIYGQYKQSLVNVEMRHYGASCLDGSLLGGETVGLKMKEANIAWHLKPLGGIGHSTMGWFASGRPLITNMSQHRAIGGEALKLFIPGLTCIDIEQGTLEENLRKINEWLEPEANLRHCEETIKQFKEVINYDKEEIAIRAFLERLL